MDFKAELERIRWSSTGAKYIRVPRWPTNDIQYPGMSLGRAIMIVANCLPDRPPHPGEWDYNSALYALVKHWTELPVSAGKKIGQEWG